MPRYILRWDVALHVQSLTFEAKDLSHATAALGIAETLGPKFGARRFALQDVHGKHLAGWNGQAVPRERPGRQTRLGLD